MNQKLQSLTLALLLMCFVSRPTAWAQSHVDVEARQIAKVRSAIAKRGVGEGVKVQLRDRTEVKGHVLQIGAENFAVKDRKAGATTSIPYSDVKEVKGQGLSTGAKIGISVAIAAGAAGALAAAAGHSISTSLSGR